MTIHGKIFIEGEITQDELEQFLEFMKKFSGFSWDVECKVITCCNVDSSGYVIKK